MVSEKAVVVSDVHLGVRKEHGNVTPPDRNQFKDFLRALREERFEHLRDVKHLVLNGDIEDLWRRHLRTLTRENSDIYNLLYELRTEKGVEIHYVRGNHDSYARWDRGGEISGLNEPYYDTEHEDKWECTIDGTRYRFRHGYQYDPAQIERTFDVAAVISGDATGATVSDLYAMLGEVKGRRGTFPVLREIGGLIYDRRKGSFGDRLTEMDVEESDRKKELGIAGAASRLLARRKISAVDEVREDPDIDWLCIGHTHNPGIVDTERNDVDPSRVNGGVANSGMWKGGIDTYLILENHPRLMYWNNGGPYEHKYPDYPKRKKWKTLVERLLLPIRKQTS